MKIIVQKQDKRIHIRSILTFPIHIPSSEKNN